MTIKAIIRSEKTNLKTGKWARGHIPRSAFPLSRLKDKRYRYGPDYAWRLVTFDAAGHNCRVLITLNESKEVLRARLGVDINGVMVVLCDYEYHATEPGWHCHVTTEPIKSIGSGAARSGKKKWPRRSTRRDFNVDEKGALSVVANHYRFAAQGELL